MIANLAFPAHRLDRLAGTLAQPYLQWSDCGIRRQKRIQCSRATFQAAKMGCLGEAGLKACALCGRAFSPKNAPSTRDGRLESIEDCHGIDDASLAAQLWRRRWLDGVSPHPVQRPHPLRAQKRGPLKLSRDLFGKPFCLSEDSHTVFFYLIQLRSGNTVPFHIKVKERSKSFFSFIVSSS
jgi:hypothetical protein